MNINRIHLPEYNNLLREYFSSSLKVQLAKRRLEIIKKYNSGGKMKFKIRENKPEEQEEVLEFWLHNDEHGLQLLMQNPKNNFFHIVLTIDPKTLKVYTPNIFDGKLRNPIIAP